MELYYIYFMTGYEIFIMVTHRVLLHLQLTLHI